MATVPHERFYRRRKVLKVANVLESGVGLLKVAAVPQPSPSVDCPKQDPRQLGCKPPLQGPILSAV